MELWDIYDKNRIKTGRTIVRGDTLGVEEYHLAVHVWVINSKGYFLIQKRAAEVQRNPNKWSITTGAAIAGEDSYGACVREVMEEVGVEPNMDCAKMIFTLKRKKNFCDIWLVNQNISIEDCTLQKEEVSDIRWVSKREIIELLARNQFVDYPYIKEFLYKCKTLLS